MRRWPTSSRPEKETKPRATKSTDEEVDKLLSDTLSGLDIAALRKKPVEAETAGAICYPRLTSDRQPRKRRLRRPQLNLRSRHRRLRNRLPRRNQSPGKNLHR